MPSDCEGSMKAKVREYTDKDYEKVAEVWKQSFSINLRPIDTMDVYNRLIQHSPGLFLVAECDGRIVGTVFAGYDGRQATVHRLAVLPEYQQKGIGKDLMTELLKRLELLKPVEIISHVVPEKHIIDIFESLDFEECKTKHMKKKMY